VEEIVIVSVKGVVEEIVSVNGVGEVYCLWWYLIYLSSFPEKLNLVSNTNKQSKAISKKTDDM